MAYERMTLKSFSESLKAEKYETATGARRAVGKGDFGPHDKKLAHDAINAHFGEDGGKTAAPPAAKKTAKKLTKNVAKKTARVAKKTSAAAKAAPAPAAKRAYTKRAPAALKELTASSMAPEVAFPVHITTPSMVGESTLRQKNAADFVTALANLQNRTPAEQQCYEKALSAASRSLDADTAPAPKPQPVSLRDQLAGNVPPAPGVSNIPPEALAQADRSARALTGPTYGTGTIGDANSVAPRA